MPYRRVRVEGQKSLGQKLEEHIICASVGIVMLSSLSYLGIKAFEMSKDLKQTKIELTDTKTTLVKTENELEKTLKEYNATRTEYDKLVNEYATLETNYSLYTNSVKDLFEIRKQTKNCRTVSDFDNLVARAEKNSYLAKALGKEELSGLLEYELTELNQNRLELWYSQAKNTLVRLGFNDEGKILGSEQDIEKRWDEKAQTLTDHMFIDTAQAGDVRKVPVDEGRKALMIYYALNGKVEKLPQSWRKKWPELEVMSKDINIYNNCKISGFLIQYLKLKDSLLRGNLK